NKTTDGDVHYEYESGAKAAMAATTVCADFVEDVRGGVQIARATFRRALSFSKIRSGLDSRCEAESSHHSDRCLRSCTRSECSSPTCSSRGAGLRPRTCFSVINSTSL